MMPRFAIILALLVMTACTAGQPPGYRGLPSREALVPGGEVIVGRNENVYGIARKNNVSMREIIVLNDLKPPFALKPGQRLVLPASDRDSAPRPVAAPMGEIESVPMESNGLSTDSIRAVPLEDPMLPPASKTVATTVTPTPGGIQSEQPVNGIQAAPMQQAQSTFATPDESIAEEKAAISFAWPVQGPILSAFGSKGQGMNNDGINIGAPKGAPVTAASSGIVVYAGNEMKGFGNLVLIRHEGGWVTAYAHLQRILVTKDNVVAVGDMIGTVGTTGGVSAPQLHFETRLDGKPVDPQSVIKKAG